MIDRETALIILDEIPSAPALELPQAIMIERTVSGVTSWKMRSELARVHFVRY